MVGIAIGAAGSSDPYTSSAGHPFSPVGAYIAGFGASFLGLFAYKGWRNIFLSYQEFYLFVFCWLLAVLYCACSISEQPREASILTAGGVSMYWMCVLIVHKFPRKHNGLQLTTAIVLHTLALNHFL